MMTRIQFPAWGRDFSLCHHVQTNPEAHPTSYPVGTPGVKRPECEDNRSFYLVPGSRMHGVLPPFPVYAFIAWQLDPREILPCNGIIHAVLLFWT
jgi:hypothetical protein